MVLSLFPGITFPAEAAENKPAGTSGEEAALLEAEPVRLRIVPPANPTVIQGTALDISGLEVYVVYSDASERSVTDYTLTGVNSSALGEQTVTVQYGELTGTFSVSVESKPEEDYIAGFFLLSKPKREYIQGEPLDLTGMRLMVYHHISPTELVGPENCVVTGFNTNQIGVQTLTVSYGGKSSEFLVVVKPGDGSAPPEDTPNLMAPRMSIESVLGGKIVNFSRDNNNDSSYGGQAAIYYTLDGSVPEPGAEGTTQYTRGGILIEETTTVKAVAALLTEKGTVKETSTVITGRVSVSQVETPTPANPNHRNNQGPGGGMTELEPGTLVSLLCNTSGASIYYWIEGQMGSEEDSRYGGSVYIDNAYADESGELTLCAYATKDGCRNSRVMRLHYRVPVVEPPKTESVNVSVGTVHSRAGENSSASLSITTEASSSVTGFSITVSYDRRSVEFVSVSPTEGEDGISASQLFSAPDVQNGTVRILCSGITAAGGEMCMLNFRVFDATEDQEISLNVDAAQVSTGSGRPVEEQTYGGAIILAGSHNSQLTASVTFSDENNSDVSNAGELADSARTTASITVDEESARAYVDTVMRENENNPTLTVTANAFVAFYGDDGRMLALESWEIDLSDLAYLLFERMMSMPDETSDIKTMVLSETLTPIMAADEL